MAMWFVCLLAVVQLCDPVFSENLEGVYKNKLTRHEYDYIVVGGGSAGAIVASRLSEHPSISVLLLETGGLPSGKTETPLLGIHLVGSEYDWRYYTEPQEKACLGFKDQKAYIPTAKVLGGGTSINSMLYLRGDRRDFDEWATGGAAGWSWDDVLYYFKKLEDLRVPEYASSDIHGTSGPQTLEISPHGSELRDAIFEAGKSLGYDIVDLNEESPLGFSKVQASIRDGRRCGTERAYLRPASSRENLDILCNAHVTKVLFDQDKRARSVRFEQNSASHVIRATREIILSAGAIGTPQILMLSGVGPKGHLQELGIPVVADLPVGENFHDHVMTGSQVYALNSSIGLLHSRVVNPETLGQFLDGKGPLTVPLGVEAIAAINSKYQDPAEKWSDLRFYFVSTFQEPPIDQSEDKPMSLKNQEGVTVSPSVSRPKSRGFVKLRSTNPYEHMIIDPKYLTDEEGYDIKVLVDGLKFLSRLFQVPSLAQYNPVRIVVPGCENMEEDSDELLTCLARTLTLTGYHPCCTAKMGRTDDPTTVVDTHLRVKGVSGLRVVDASVMPVITSANTNAPALMIGEKAADLIQGKRWDPAQKKVVSIDQ